MNLNQIVLFVFSVVAGHLLYRAIRWQMFGRPPSSDHQATMKRLWISRYSTLREDGKDIIVSSNGATEAVRSYAKQHNLRIDETA